MHATNGEMAQNIGRDAHGMAIHVSDAARFVDRNAARPVGLSELRPYGITTSRIARSSLGFAARAFSSTASGRFRPAFTV